MASVTRSLTGRIVVRLDEDEKIVLASLIAQVFDLVHADAPAKSEDPLAELVGTIGVDVETPEDPALARLFPDAYPEDRDASRDFRRYTQESLRELKIAQATTVDATLERSGNKVTLSDAEAFAWLAALNDLRLVLGVRLGVSEENTEEFENPDDPRHQMYSIYAWLSFLQESLIHVIAPQTQ